MLRYVNKSLNNVARWSPPCTCDSCVTWPYGLLRGKATAAAAALEFAAHRPVASYACTSTQIESVTATSCACRSFCSLIYSEEPSQVCSSHRFHVGRRANLYACFLPVLTCWWAQKTAETMVPCRGTLSSLCMRQTLYVKAVHLLCVRG